MKLACSAKRQGGVYVCVCSVSFYHYLTMFYVFTNLLLVPESLGFEVSSLPSLLRFSLGHMPEIN